MRTAPVRIKEDNQAWVIMPEAKDVQIVLLYLRPREKIATRRRGRSVRHMRTLSATRARITTTLLAVNADTRRNGLFPTAAVLPLNCGR
jgi:hypothetical protein